MSEKKKLVEAGWWRLSIPVAWDIEETRSGKRFLLDVESGAILDVICLKKDVGNFEDEDLFRFVSGSGKMRNQELLKVKNYRYLKVRGCRGNPGLTRWGVCVENTLLLATYDTGSRVASEVELQEIDEILQGIDFI